MFKKLIETRIYFHVSIKFGIYVLELIFTL
jgi:hypothetical protein